MDDIKKDKSSYLIETCTYCIMGGVGITAIYPPFALIGLTMNAAGALGIGYYAWHWNKFTKIFKCLDLGTNEVYPLLKKKIKNEQSTIYKFTLPAGLSLKDFEDKKEAIEQYLGREIDVRYTFKEIEIEEYKVKQRTFYEFELPPTDYKVPLIAGYDRQSKLIVTDLSKSDPHVLIAGSTGSGKSTILRSIITTLILRSECKLHLVDLKNGTEFALFKNCKSVESFCRKISEAETLLKALNEEVDRRYDMFYECDCKDIEEYNKKHKEKLDYQVVIIDEFADLQDNKTCKFYLELLARLARACGIHIIISTQRPDAKVLNGSIKANVTTVIGLATKDVTNSRIIIDEPGLENLKSKGSAIFKTNESIKIQCPYLDTERCRELIKHTYIKKNYQKIEKEIDFSKVGVFNDDEERF